MFYDLLGLVQNLFRVPIVPLKDFKYKTTFSVWAGTNLSKPYSWSEKLPLKIVLLKHVLYIDLGNA